MDEMPLGEAIAYPGAAEPRRRVLEGGHVRLEPLAVAHAADLWPEVSAPGAEAGFTYLLNGPYGSAEALAAQLAEYAGSDDPLLFAIRPHRTARAQGWASFMRIVPPMGVIEIGHIWLALDLQRTTAATEAIFLMMAHAMDDLGNRRLEWKCNALNAPSRRAAERFGFTYEGTFRRHMVVKGRSRDTAWYAIIDVDWPRIRAGFRAWLDPANFDRDGRQRRTLAEIRGSLA
jgi:RimJ/RimL family protein N-acetyltransferase